MDTFRKAYVVEFPLERVFAKWVAEGTVVAPAKKVEIEARVGGVYRLLMPDGTVMEGIFSEFSENRRVTYSWNWVGSDEITEVDVTFESQPDGTAVHVTHSGFASPESLQMHSSGWDSYLSGFAAHLNASS